MSDWLIYPHTEQSNHKTGLFMHVVYCSHLWNDSAKYLVKFDALYSVDWLAIHWQPDPGQQKTPKP